MIVNTLKEADSAWLIEPERRLMVAVLDEAMTSFRDGLDSASPAARKEAFQVETWVRSEDIRWPFSFENICTALDIDAQAIRADVVAMKRQSLRKRSLVRSCGHYPKVRRGTVRQASIG